MVGEPPVGEQPAVDPRVEGLDPAVEHLRASRSRRPRPSPAGPASRSARAVPPVETSSKPRATRPRPRSARPALSDTDSSARRGTGSARVGARRGRSPRGARRPARHAPASSSATARGSRRCSTAWIRACSASSSSPGRTGTASWATIGPPSSVASTRWTVTPVTATPCARASRTACAPGNAGSSDGWVLRMRPANAPRTAGPDEPHVARRARSTSGRAPARVSASASSSPPRDERRVDPLLGGPVERRAGPVGEHQDDLAAELAAGRGRGQRPQVRARPRTRRPRSARPLTRSRDRLQRALHVAGAAESRRVDDLADDARRDAAVAPARRSPSRPPRGGTTATIPSPPLNVARSSSSSRPAERAEQAHDRRHRPARRVEARAEARRAAPAARCPAGRRP